jgi:hypothetical protein
MTGPPEPETRNRPAANGTAYRKGPIEPLKIAETTAERQARSLRGRLALGYYFAGAIAPLIWGPVAMSDRKPVYRARTRIAITEEQIERYDLPSKPRNEKDQTVPAYPGNIPTILPKRKTPQRWRRAEFV